CDLQVMSLASYHCSTPGRVLYFGPAGAPGGPLAAAFDLAPLCPLNVRVGANSPNLCPTMSSVTNSFINCRPLCTRNVCPIKSGTTVQSRDQVLIGSR